MIRSLLIAQIRFYQRFVSPLTGTTCRFYPSCSSYALQSIEKHGILKGLVRTALRLGRCHPFHPGGYDPVT